MISVIRSIFLAGSDKIKAKTKVEWAWLFNYGH
jgi:hypothetical protein